VIMQVCQFLRVDEPGASIGEAIRRGRRRGLRHDGLSVAGMESFSVPERLSRRKAARLQRGRLASNDMASRGGTHGTCAQNRGWRSGANLYLARVRRERRSCGCPPRYRHIVAGVHWLNHAPPVGRAEARQRFSSSSTSHDHAKGTAHARIVPHFAMPVDLLSPVTPLFVARTSSDTTVGSMWSTAAICFEAGIKCSTGRRYQSRSASPYGRVHPRRKVTGTWRRGRWLQPRQVEAGPPAHDQGRHSDKHCRCDNPLCPRLEPAGKRLGTLQMILLSPTPAKEQTS